MTTVLVERIAILDESGIVTARQAAGRTAKRLGMGVVDQTKIATATSELARNIVRYAKRGEVVIEEVADAVRVGVQVTFKDAGPGIADVEMAMRDGFTTGGGMGLGLSGAKRLMNEFEIRTQAGQGTTVVIRKWKNL